MKNILSLLILFAIVGQLQAQDISSTLSSAKTSYTSGSLDDARFALEQSLQQIDQAIGEEILKILPTDLSEISYQEQEDNVVGTNMGFAGLFVNRYYGVHGEQNANIEIIGDSPLMASVNAILAMPTILTGGDSNQKRIKIDGYKSLIEKETNENGVEIYKVQIPANSTLISFNCEGFSESQAISMAGTIPVSEIVRLAQ